MEDRNPKKNLSTPKIKLREASAESRSFDDSMVNNPGGQDNSFDCSLSKRSAKTSVSNCSTNAIQMRLQGIFYNVGVAGIEPRRGETQVCPFPSDLQFGTIPECIVDDDELD